MQDKDYLAEYYGSYDEDGRLLTRHGQVEYRTTMRYIERYLRPGMRTLEIGAATGRYSHALAQRGYRVDAVELLEHNIELFRANTQPGEEVTITQADARDLRAFSDETYDMTLVLGPMYHLYTREDQHKALAEAVRVTKTGGVVFVAYCMGDASILSHGFGKNQIRELIRLCNLDPVTFKTFSHPWDLFQLYRKEDIQSLRESFSVTPLHFVATDGFARHLRDKLTEMDEETFSLYLAYHLATCERQDMVGVSHHTLDIFRKET